MLNYFTYNGVSSENYQTFLSGAGAFELPKRDITKVEIPGRNGDLIIDNERYENVKIKYPIIIMQDFEINKRLLVHELSKNIGYQRLEDTFNPNHFRMANFEGISNSKTTYQYDAGSFVLEFDCKPQLYLKSGEQSFVVSEEKNILNSTYEIALPIIKITGIGGFRINNDYFNLLSNTGVTIVDCEAKEVYEGTINRNDDFERYNNELPKLYVGENEVVCDNGVSLEIIPRWWTI